VINETQKKALYGKYLAIFNAHKSDPVFFTLPQSNTELTTIMGGRHWSWHVIGITKAALEIYKECGFRYKSKQGLTRAHIKPRIETSKELLTADLPVSQEEFFEIWLNADKTIICGPGENRSRFVPEYIPLENNDYSLFKSHTVGWKESAHLEGKLLRELYERYCLSN
jgi:hypothetical protein